VIRQRTVYSNLGGSDQNQAILREAVFDARSARLTTLRDYKATGKPSMEHPILATRYVWMDVRWLQAALRSFEDLAIPVKEPPGMGSQEAYWLGIIWPDGTRIEARWRW